MISVLIVTYGRNPALLFFLVREWAKYGFEIVVVSHAKWFGARLDDVPGFRFVAHDVSAREYGNAIQAGLDSCANEFVYLAADDILPVSGWKQPPCTPNSISAIKLLTVNGRRYYDWAYVRGDVVSKNCTIHLQEYSAHAAQTYITGGAQLIHVPGVCQGPASVTYRGGVFRESEDVLFCFNAERAGVAIIPPNDHSPVCIHLNEKEL
jgi:hypothetical protein